MDITAISIINNKGVDLLRRGDLKTAANTFKVALELSLTQLRLWPTSANGTAECNCFKSCAESLSQNALT